MHKKFHKHGRDLGHGRTKRKIDSSKDKIDNNSSLFEVPEKIPKCKTSNHRHGDYKKAHDGERRMDETLNSKKHRSKKEKGSKYAEKDDKRVLLSKYLEDLKNDTTQPKRHSSLGRHHIEHQKSGKTYRKEQTFCVNDQKEERKRRYDEKPSRYSEKHRDRDHVLKKSSTESNTKNEDTTKRKHHKHHKDKYKKEDKKFLECIPNQVEAFYCQLEPVTNTTNKSYKGYDVRDLYLPKTNENKKKERIRKEDRESKGKRKNYVPTIEINPVLVEYNNHYKQHSSEKPTKLLEEKNTTSDVIQHSRKKHKNRDLSSKKYTLDSKSVTNLYNAEKVRSRRRETTKENERNRDENPSRKKKYHSVEKSKDHKETLQDKIEEDIKSYFTKIQTIIDKKLDSILKTTKQKEFDLTTEPEGTKRRSEQHKRSSSEKKRTKSPEADSKQLKEKNLNTKSKSPDRKQRERSTSEHHREKYKITEQQIEQNRRNRSKTPIEEHDRIKSTISPHKLENKKTHGREKPHKTEHVNLDASENISAERLKQESHKQKRSKVAHGMRNSDEVPTKIEKTRENFKHPTRMDIQNNSTLEKSYIPTEGHVTKNIFPQLKNFPNADQNRIKNRCVVEGVIEPPNLEFPRPGKRPINKNNFECKTVSIVGIPSQVSEDPITKQSDEEEMVEKKKKTRRFQLYYKYSDKNSDNGSDLRSIMSDSHRKISDPSDDSPDSENVQSKPISQYVKLSKFEEKHYHHPEIPVNNIFVDRLHRKHKYRIVTPDESKLNYIVEEPSNISCICKHNEYFVPIKDDLDYRYFKLLTSSHSDYCFKINKKPGNSDISINSKPDKHSARYAVIRDSRRDEARFVSKSDIVVLGTSLKHNIIRSKSDVTMRSHSSKFINNNKSYGRDKRKQVTSDRRLNNQRGGQRFFEELAHIFDGRKNDYTWTDRNEHRGSRNVDNFGYTSNKEYQDPRKSIPVPRKSIGFQKNTSVEIALQTEFEGSIVNYEAPVKHMERFNERLPVNTHDVGVESDILPSYIPPQAIRTTEKPKNLKAKFDKSPLRNKIEKKEAVTTENTVRSPKLPRKIERSRKVDHSPIRVPAKLPQPEKPPLKPKSPINKRKNVIPVILPMENYVEERKTVPQGPTMTLNKYSTGKLNEKDHYQCTDDLAKTKITKSNLPKLVTPKLKPNRSKSVVTEFSKKDVYECSNQNFQCCFISQYHSEHHEENGTKAVLKRSKSLMEINAKRQCTFKSSKSGVNLLDDSSEYDQRIRRMSGNTGKLRSKSKSTGHSLDRYLATENQALMSRLFLTKDYKGSEISAYQKRKLYDDLIRKKMRRKFHKEELGPQVYEVRFLTLMNNETEASKNSPDFISENTKMYVPEVHCILDKVNRPNPYQLDSTSNDESSDFSTKAVFSELLEMMSIPQKHKPKPIDFYINLAKANNTKYCNDKDCVCKNLLENAEICPGFHRFVTYIQKSILRYCELNSKHELSSEQHKSKTTTTKMEEAEEHEAACTNRCTQATSDTKNNLACSQDIGCQHENSCPEVSSSQIVKNYFPNASKAKVSPKKKDSGTCDPMKQITEDTAIKTSQISLFHPNSCPVLNSTSSTFDFLYESGPNENFDKEQILKNLITPLNQEPEQTYNQFHFQEIIDVALPKERARTASPPFSENSSGYNSVISKKTSSLCNFFKKPNIAALFQKPVKHAASVVSTIMDVGEYETTNFYEEMTRSCHQYASKIRKHCETQSYVEEGYLELPLDVILGKNSCTVIEEDTAVGAGVSASVSSFGASCSMRMDTGSQIEERSMYGCKLILSNETMNTESATFLEKNIFTDYKQEEASLKSIIMLNSQEIINDVSSNSLLHFNNPDSMKQLMAKKFFKKLLSVYEREIEVSVRLANDEDFFQRVLLPSVDKLNLDQQESTYKKRKKKFTRFFKRNKSSNRESETNASALPEKTLPGENEIKLQELACNARRYFTMFAQAVKANQNINDEIKICGLLKLLETIERGDFKLLRRAEEVNFDEEIRDQIRQAFISVYKISLREAKKKKRSLTNNDLQLIRSFVSRFRIGLLSKTDIIATYIGRGIIASEVQLKAAVTYLMRSQTAVVDMVEFEKYCMIVH